MKKFGFLCQSCGIEAPTRNVTFNQNIGMLVMRQRRTARGRFCRNCINKHFWKMTGTTLAIGWLGTISLVIAPIFVISNTVAYLAALGLPSVPPGARAPKIDERVAGAVFPQLGTIIDRLNAGEDFDDVAVDVASKTTVAPPLTPGEVQVYVIEYIRNRKSAAPAPPAARGFEVVQKEPPPLPPTA